MNWKKILPWSKETSDPTAAYKSLDHKLLKNTQSHYFPRWAQLKYVSRFLAKDEKRVVRLALMAAVVSALALVGLFVSRHIVVLPQEGGEYVEAMVGQPKYLNPLFASTNDVDADLTSLVYSGLFRYNEKRQLVPDLAENYSISADKKVYEVKLKDSISWSDGEPFTAEDVLLTYELIQNPEIGSPLFAAFQGVEVARVGDNTVRFTLSQPFAPFVQSLTHGILPEHIWTDSNATNIRLAKNNIQPIGTGPWQFDKLLKDESGTIQSYSLKRNENYYGAKPYLKNLTFKFFYDPVQATDQALEALKSRAVDGVSFVSVEQKKKINQRRFTSYELRLPQYTALFFNSTHAATLRDESARRALAQAIQKNQLVLDIFGTDATPVDGPFLAGTVSSNLITATSTFSVENANALLDKQWTRLKPEDYYSLRHDALLKQYEDNWKELNDGATSTAAMSPEEKSMAEKTITASVRAEMNVEQAFYRRDKDKNILMLTITTVNTPEYEQVARWVAAAWEKIGVKTFVKTVDNSQITRDILRNRSYDILLYGELTTLDPDPFPFWHSSQADDPGLNLANFSNRTADKLLEDARVTFDLAKRAELYAKFQTILDKEIPAIFLYAPIHSLVINNRIKGVAPALYLNTPADRFNDLNNWYVKTQWEWE